MKFLSRSRTLTTSKDQIFNPNFRSKMYVKVYGTIRVFKEEKAIVGTHIKKIDKFDEVTNHLLQVFVAHCIRQKGVLTKNDLR